MANELQISFRPNQTVYFLIRNRVGQIWSTSGGTGAFTAYQTANYTDYSITGTQQGSASAMYTGSVPAGLLPGVYGVLGKQQLGGSVAESDPALGSENYQWNGTVTLPLSDLATSGQIGTIAPIRAARGCMIQNFPVYLKSSADHLTPFTSGTVSGQIARDGGSFGALQSGAFTETGLGYYNLQALTSGDVLANTVKLVFTATNPTGGTSDPLPISLLLQRTSGQ